MPDLKLLERIISNSGMTMVSIAEKSGILRETLYNKVRGSSEFKASEIAGLTRALKLTNEQRDAIFFADESDLIQQPRLQKRTRRERERDGAENCDH